MRPRVGLLSACAFALLAATLAATVTLAAPGLLPAARGGADLPVHAVCYGPHRDGQRPDGPAPSTAELREDLHLLAAHWKLVRVYGSRGPAETMLEIIRDDSLDLKVMLGAWIGTNRADALETVASLLADLGTLDQSAKTGMAGLAPLIAARKLQTVDYAGWQRIDAEEKRRGECISKPREKFTRVDEMLSVAAGS